MEELTWSSTIAKAVGKFHLGKELNVLIMWKEDGVVGKKKWKSHGWMKDTRMWLFC